MWLGLTATRQCSGPAKGRRWATCTQQGSRRARHRPQNVTTRAEKYRVLIGDHPSPNGSRATPDHCRKTASGPIGHPSANGDNPKRVRILARSRLRARLSHLNWSHVNRYAAVGTTREHLRRFGGQPQLAARCGSSWMVAVARWAASTGERCERYRVDASALRIPTSSSGSRSSVSNRASKPGHWPVPRSTTVRRRACQAVSQGRVPGPATPGPCCAGRRSPR